MSTSIPILPLAALRRLIISFLLLSLITGILYPLLTYALGQGLFQAKANGSLINSDGKLRGSMLIGQAFSAPHYFWSRPSATANFANNGEASGGSNLAPSNPAFREAVAERIANVRAAHPDAKAPIPAELVTTSASGLDPHISLAAAEYQLTRVASQRHMTIEQLRATVKRYTEEPQWGIFGETRVNVLALNLALDQEHPIHPEPSTHQ
ncbi:potassium-transporting ATPase subunit KdpC [Undibacterium cyanobacteriorum]|uniref:Potassium-transporting ATPase KdpC subunit n=1 Tax=Undibacterium cyanobacteriorum TaxID=3073561 RepID=A0ABY9RPE7_9BURK|nr:potassium-transporting ATPase subunit KdpC [Undibacterium sp. 20NA77.5]WMW81866.1 potassium-transporting ATPase subunit KdpC [Undibacterium sp. 20NA77.5]